MNQGITPVTADVERLLEGLDENLNPIEEGTKDEGDSTAENDGKEDVAVEEAKEQTDEEEESASDENAETTEKDSGDEGYAIDEDDEETTEEVATTSTEEAKKNPQLSAEETYIVENLAPITVRGTVDDKPVELTVFSPEQLPDGFKFNDDKARSIADKNFNMLESRARDLQGQYRNQESAKAAKEFSAREKAADRADIADMQREGIIPKFKASADSKEFENDPAAKLIQEVLNFKDKENQRFLEDSNTGRRPYKHIGFEEAYLKFQRSNPTKTRSPEQTAEDAERKEIARRTTKTSGTDNRKENKAPEVFKSSRDLNNFIDNLGWE